MRKIKTLFKRDFDTPRHPIIAEYNDGVEWVINGEGLPTRKYDGTSVLIRDGKAYKRYELKDGKTAPEGFELADHDEVTGKSMGWVPISPDAPEDKYHREALPGGHVEDLPMLDGTYELIGPKVQGNDEKADKHTLIRHAEATVYNYVPTEFEELKAWLETQDIEGIVWHHTDGRMVKIKKKDFGLKRG